MTTFELASSSEVVDASGSAAISVEGCLELSFVCAGTATGNVTVSLTECDTADGTYTDVSEDDVYGAFTLSSADSTTTKVGIIGYKGWKNYVKVKVTGTTTSLSVVALRSGCRHCPTQ